MDSCQTEMTPTQWLVIAEVPGEDREHFGMVAWGPFADEEEAKEFIEAEGHLPEIYGRYEDEPHGLKVFAHPVYDPATHLAFRKEWDIEDGKAGS